LVKKKRDLSKNTVLKFNEAVKKIFLKKIQHFIEVAEIINELIVEKIFSSRTKRKRN
jgi:hypothetical protein